MASLQGAPGRPSGDVPFQNGDLRLNVLVVEDDALVALDVITTLRDLGHVAVEAGSAEEALTLLEASRYDLVLTDYQLRAMTGGGLAFAVRERWPRTKVALLSGYVERPVGVPADIPWMAKPFTSRDIAALLEALSPWLHGNP